MQTAPPFWSRCGLSAGGLDECRLMRRSTRDPNGYRKTGAVCNCHDPGPLATLRFSDAEAPFFAPAKVPSMKASVMSSLPRTYKSSASPGSTRSIVPSPGASVGSDGDRADIRRVALRQILPWSAGAKDPLDADQHIARIAPRSTPTVGG